MSRIFLCMMLIVSMSTKIRVPKNHKFSTDCKIEGHEGGGSPAPLQAGAMDSTTMATSSPAPKELGRAYGCVWTMYEYEGLMPSLRDYVDKNCTYAVWGEEICPKTKRPHLQGYVHWENKRSLAAFSKAYKNCHVEIPRGSPRQNRVYCTKEGKFEEFGVLPTQGHRTDWDKAVQDIKDGREVADVICDQPQMIVAQRALREFKAMLLKPLHREVNVICLIGDAGTGKTRWAFENHPDLYKKPVGDWWDGYTGQKTILMDDFYGWIKYHDLLTLLDRYPTNLPVKGGYMWAQYDTVIITSNKMPQHWYKDLGLTPALRRRLKKVIYYTSIDGIPQTQELSLQEAQSGTEEACDA